eukprot:5871539-Pleurochrysis_carterae.AAC.1
MRPCKQPCDLRAWLCDSDLRECEWFAVRTRDRVEASQLTLAFRLLPKASQLTLAFRLLPHFGWP